MNKILLLIIFAIHAFSINAQLAKNEKRTFDSLLQTGRLTSKQVIELQKWSGNEANYAFSVNKGNGEIEVTDIIPFTNDKRVLFQRCLQWIAINYGNLVYNDLESGKIVANGTLDLTTYDGSQTGLRATKVSQIPTPVSYTMILTVKDNKLKYTITNISYTFTNLLYPESDVTYPISAIYPLKNANLNLIRYYTSLDASSDMFYSKLKNSLADYLKEAENDYDF